MWVAHSSKKSNVGIVVVEADELNDAIEQGVQLSLPQNSSDTATSTSLDPATTKSKTETGKTLSVSETKYVLPGIARLCGH